MATELNLEVLCYGTEGRNRTDTPVKEPDFESGASTSSATPAQQSGDYTSGFITVNWHQRIAQ